VGGDHEGAVGALVAQVEEHLGADQTAGDEEENNVSMYTHRSNTYQNKYITHTHREKERKKERKKERDCVCLCVHFRKRVADPDPLKPRAASVSRQRRSKASTRRSSSP